MTGVQTCALPICFPVTIDGAIAVNADISVETNFSEGTIFCDISSEESIKNTVFTVLEKYGRIDGLVNNAYPRTSDWGAFFENIPLESWRKNVDMQLNSTFLFCQLVLEQMKKQGSGSVVNIGSIYGVVGNDFTIYEHIVTGKQIGRAHV